MVSEGFMNQVCFTYLWWKAEAIMLLYFKVLVHGPEKLCHLWPAFELLVITICFSVRRE
jgi:hypothetical protein